MATHDDDNDHTGLTAQRFQGKPLTQPTYSFRNVPKCERDLTNSSITYIDRREPFVDSMAEMILLTKEVRRRQAEAEDAAEAAAAASKKGKSSSKKNNRKSKKQQDGSKPKRTSKPLSLEYMADRTDVDDPIFGYFVRSKELPQEYADQVKDAAAAKAAAADINDNDNDSQTKQQDEANTKTANATPSGRASRNSKRRRGESEPSQDESASASGAAANDDEGDRKPSAKPSTPVDSLQSLAAAAPSKKSASASTATMPYRHKINPLKFQSDMLQGFITVTTFTNWQTTFRWDSMHDSAFSYDEPDMAAQMANGERAYDYDGTLAEAMQASVRSGDPWNEGIVWPRIAEISLLGALGCGKTLVKLAIEKLENMPATGSHNYDFVCLQATENSIPFYEAMGFVRVGAILEDDKFEAERRGQQVTQGAPKSVPSLDSEESSLDNTSSSDSGLGLVETTSGVFSSLVDTYVVKKQWERIEEVAKKFDVDVWDIIFLNKEVYEDIMPRSWLKKGTKLFVPSEQANINAVSDARRARQVAGDGGKMSEAPLWYNAKNNDTPKMIAEMFGAKVSELIAANRDRLPGLIGTSRLKPDTRVKVSRFDLHDDRHVPYCHWMFPDDTFKDSEPSYMMAMKINRGKKTKAKKALAIPIEEYVHVEAEKKDGEDVEMEEAEKVEVSEPVKPKKPMSAYNLYSAEQRKALKREFPGLSIRELKKIMSQKWKDLPGIDKANYEHKVKTSKTKYDADMKQYEKDLKDFRKANPDWESSKSKKKDDSLVNGVVRLTGHEEGDGGFEYYYCLTYIPDLQWCHLAPLRKTGSWGPGKEWRYKWVLVDESEGKEVDVSSTFCEVVKANPSKNSIDADEEVWDIPNSKPMPISERPIPNLPKPTQHRQYPVPPYPHGRTLAPYGNGQPFPPYGVPPPSLPDHHGHKRKRAPGGPPMMFPPPSHHHPQFFTPHHVQGCGLNQMFEAHDPATGSHKRRKMTPFGVGPTPAFNSALTDRILPDGSLMPKIPPARGSDGLYVKPRGRSPLGYDWDARAGVWISQGPLPHVTPDHRNTKRKPRPSPVWDESNTPDSIPMEDIPEPGMLCKDALYYATFDDETCAEVAAKLGCSSRDLAGANFDRYGSIKADSRFEERTLLRLPSQCAVCGILGSNNGKSPMVTCDGCDTSFHLSCTEEKLTQVPLEDWYCSACVSLRSKLYSTPAAAKASNYLVCRSAKDVDRFPTTVPLIVSLPNPLKSSGARRSKSGSGSKAKKQSTEEFTPGFVCKDGVFYCTLDDETCIDVANKLGCNWRNVAIANKKRYGVIKGDDRFEEKTLLLIPKSIDPVKILALSKNPQQQTIEIYEPATKLEVFEPGHTCTDGIYYCTIDDETCEVVAHKLGCTWKELSDANKERYGNIRASARFEEGTTLIIPPVHDAAKVKMMCKANPHSPAPMPSAKAVKAAFNAKPAAKSDWTDQEDAALSEAVLKSSEQPFKNWTSLVKLFPGRTGKKIRDRWVNHLNPNLNFAPFSREDNILLWEGQRKYGNKWVEISTNCFNSTRSENHVKNQWYSTSFKNFVADEFAESKPEATPSPQATSSPEAQSRPSPQLSDTPPMEEEAEPEVVGAKAGNCKADSTGDVYSTNEKGAEEEKSEEDEEPETYYPGHVCQDMIFYTTLDNETPRQCATKLGCEWRDLVNVNKSTYKGLVASSKLEEGTILRIPEKNDIKKLEGLYKYEEKLDICCECYAIEKPDGPPMLLCDGCDAACHLPCSGLTEVPEGDWFCKKCSSKKSSTDA